MQMTAALLYLLCSGFSTAVWIGPSPRRNYYWTESGRLNHSSADAACKALGLNLPSFETNEELSYASDAAEPLADVKYCYWTLSDLAVLNMDQNEVCSDSLGFNEEPFDTHRELAYVFGVVPSSQKTGKAGIGASGGGFWVSQTDEATEGNWLDHSGRAGARGLKWLPGQPGNQYPFYHERPGEPWHHKHAYDRWTEDCVSLLKEYGWQANDVPCGLHNNWMCENINPCKDGPVVGNNMSVSSVGTYPAGTVTCDAGYRLADTDETECALINGEWAWNGGALVPCKKECPTIQNDEHGVIGASVLYGGQQTTFGCVQGYFTNVTMVECDINGELSKIPTCMPCRADIIRFLGGCWSQAMIILLTIVAITAMALVATFIYMWVRKRTKEAKTTTRG